MNYRLGIVGCLLQTVDWELEKVDYGWWTDNIMMLLQQ